MQLRLEVALLSHLQSAQSIIGAIKEAASSIAGQKCDVVIPVYLGGTMLDEVIVTAQQRANLRSGGR